MIEDVCNLIYEGLYVCEDEFFLPFLYMCNSTLSIIG